MNLDSNQVAKRRKFKKWSNKQLLVRVIWSVGALFFRYSPRHFWAFRRVLLRFFGAKVGKGVRVYPDVNILIPWNLLLGNWVTIGSGATLYALGQIRIGNEVTISQGAHLCAGTHDYEHSSFALIKSSIDVKDRAWICADAFVGPNVIVGYGAVVAARAVAIKTIEDWTVVGGNPAKKIKSRVLLN